MNTQSLLAGTPVPTIEPHVVIQGSLAAGFTTTGPFLSRQEARGFARGLPAGLWVECLPLDDHLTRTLTPKAWEFAQRVMNGDTVLMVGALGGNMQIWGPFSAGDADDLKEALFPDTEAQTMPLCTPRPDLLAAKSHWAPFESLPPGTRFWDAGIRYLKETHNISHAVSPVHGASGIAEHVTFEGDKAVLVEEGDVVGINQELLHRQIGDWDHEERGQRPQYEVRLTDNGALSDQLLLMLAPKHGTPDELEGKPALDIFIEVNQGLPAIHISRPYGDVAFSVFGSNDGGIVIRRGDAPYEITDETPSPVLAEAAGSPEAEADSQVAPT